ncbi:hypothetical protein Clacol_008477 [Clathrus columnatus]|uniref:Extracellular metalloproteinase n=1 Tax=Clathrus columnatus TaxID=1419009 RepID=A0AAV5AQS0_9AGAM|nr:hypothetical protein Clacol_008477 [Clathrus columnatus]
MRSTFKTLLVLTSIALSFAHSEQAFTRRKSLAFGPSLPHATFTTSPSPHLSFSRSFAPSDPFDVARSFLDSLLADLDSKHLTYVIRDDSYTDKRTGVTHIYVNQYVNGLEVTDGRINVNIKDGQVLSYGDSFYRGPAPLHDNVEAPSVHKQFCDTLHSKYTTHMQDYASLLQQTQIPLADTELDRHRGELDFLQDVHNTDCHFLKRDMTAYSQGSRDPAAAALMFMMAATPSMSLADDMHSRFHDYLSEVTVIPSNHLRDQAPSFAVQQVPGAVNPVKAHLAYAQVPNGDRTGLKLVWQLEVEMEDNWYSASVDASNPSNIISVVDWASDSSAAPIPPPKEPKGSTYQVFKWGINDPAEGERTIEKENFDNLASPLGWHSLPASKLPAGYPYDRSSDADLYTADTTIGNNVYAHENWEGRNSWVNNLRPKANSASEFHYDYDPAGSDRTDPMAVAKGYINATVTQLFYTTNMVHDLYYRYGFDEVSGNFQQHNFGRGGRDGDAVIANAQDGSGFNNANFMTPPDGQNGRCRMYIWNTASPYRDGDLEAGIVIHELSHGLSTRLTGGPANSNCLGWGEAGGMGEGWGDFLATTIRSTKRYSDYPMGAWAANDKGGIRYYSYSLDKDVNPSTYDILDGVRYWGVHAIGEVWAEFLWIVQYKLIEKHGYSDTLFPPKPDADGVVPEADFYRPATYNSKGVRNPLIPKHGNSLMVQLVLDGMKLQPCSPSFIQARDAIIQADENLTGGENFCLLWEGFAERGLGVGAKLINELPWGGGTHDPKNTVPAKCRSSS